MSGSETVKARIDEIEEAYEYFLAYAAQGLKSDRGSKSGGQLRGFLRQMRTALDALAADLRTAVEEIGAEPADRWAELAGIVEEDASKALTAVALVEAQEDVGSQLIDNLNANIHLRAVLTDLFLVDELLG